MDNQAEEMLEMAAAEYFRVLQSHLRRYHSGAPYGKQQARDCGHWTWEITRDLPCIGCLSSQYDYAADFAVGRR